VTISRPSRPVVSVEFMTASPPSRGHESAARNAFT
jgi:hypothetical protein